MTWWEILIVFRLSLDFYMAVLQIFVIFIISNKVILLNKGSQLLEAGCWMPAQHDEWYV